MIPSFSSRPRARAEFPTQRKCCPVITVGNFRAKLPMRHCEGSVGRCPFVLEVVLFHVRFGKKRSANQTPKTKDFVGWLSNCRQPSQDFEVGKNQYSENHNYNFDSTRIRKHNNVFCPPTSSHGPKWPSPILSAHGTRRTWSLWSSFFVWQFLRFLSSPAPATTLWKLRRWSTGSRIKWHATTAKDSNATNY